VYAALAANAGVAALVGTRIYPEQAPDEAELPLVVYTVKAGEALDGLIGMWPCTAAEALGVAVRAALDGYDGQDASYLARGLWLSDYGELRDAEMSLWGRLAAFQGWIVRR
jgi:hypothetical protein